MIGLLACNHRSTISTPPHKPTTTPRRSRISLKREELTTTLSMRMFKDTSKLMNFLNVSTQPQSTVEK